MQHVVLHAEKLALYYSLTEQTVPLLTFFYSSVAHTNMYCSMQYVCSIPLGICDKVLFSVRTDVHGPVTDPLGKTTGKVEWKEM